MRLLHVVPTYLPAYRYGGPIESVHGLCRSLAALGHDVHVYTTSVDGERDSPVPHDRPVLMDGVHVHYFRSCMLRRLYWSPPMRRALARNLSSYDVVHLHSVFLWPTWAAARGALHVGVPYVLSPRGMLDKALVRRRNRWLKETWIRFIERRNLEKASAIHVTSEIERVALAQFDLRLSRVATIGNGVDVPEAASVRARAGPLLFLGRVNWKKGLESLIRALVRLPGAKLVVAGNDEEDYTSELARIARESGVAERVAFTGPLYGERKWDLYRSARCFVLPSISENFGNAVLEAMAAGCPVVVTPGVGLAEVVRRSGAGVVTEGDPDSLAAAIAPLLANDSLVEAMGRAGRETAREGFGWNGIAREMAALYAEIRAR